MNKIKRSSGPVQSGRVEPPLRVSRPPVANPLPHNLHGFCWCQPLVETQLDGSHLFIHRRSLDSPHIETIR